MTTEEQYVSPVALPPVMIMVAPTGAYATKEQNGATPISPAEIADDVVRCAEAGASIAHLHARNRDGQATQDSAVFKEIVERIREHSDIVLQLSLGTRGFGADEAMQPLSLTPEMVSFPMRAFGDADGAVPSDIAGMAAGIRDSGALPELDVTSRAMVAGARRLVEHGLVEPSCCFGVGLGEPETMREGATRLLDLTSNLPPGAQWWALKGGRSGLGLRALAIELGGHVRVGIEDSIHDFDGTGLTSSNASLVERVAALCTSLGRPVATSADVRRSLNLLGA
jgi:3-keto-5-aminohexanoate cleavage enzyme